MSDEGGGFDWEHALKIVQRAEDSFHRGAVDAIVGRYADDVMIRFAGMPDILGKPESEAFLRARFARERDYKLKKTLFMVEGFKIGATYTASWTDARTGEAMLGKGAEFWLYREDKLAL
jgi:nuclear transport factor 2 (NTF2) superfamily protein